MSEGLKRLPPTWLEVPLSEVVEVNPRLFSVVPAASDLPVHFVPMRAVTEEYGGIDVSGKRVLREVQKGYTSFLAGDVLFAKITPCMENGKLAVVPELPDHIAFGSTEFHVLRSSVAMRPEWLAYYLSQAEFRRLARQNMTGSAGQMRVPTTWLANASLPVAPEAEQTRVIAKLDELLTDMDAGVAELKAAQAKLTQYRQSLLKAAVEGELTADWRAERTRRGEAIETGAQLLERILAERRKRWEAKQLARFKEQGKAQPKGWQDRYPAPVEPDTEDLPPLPDGWVWTTVDQCALDEAAITDGPFGSNLKSEHYQDVGPRVIRLQNIGDGIFVDAEAHISQEHYEQLLKHSVEESDVVVAMLGEVLPRACEVPPGVSPAIVKADCARVRPNTNVISAKLLVASLIAQPTRTRVGRLVKGIGRPRINLGHIRSIQIPICPRDEQIEIESTLIKIEESIAEQFESISVGLKQAAAQRKNILKSAFSGQLVPQDPNDEPASALLERIRAERENARNGVVGKPSRGKRKVHG